VSNWVSCYNIILLTEAAMPVFSYKDNAYIFASKNYCSLQMKRVVLLDYDYCIVFH